MAQERRREALIERRKEMGLTQQYVAEELQSKGHSCTRSFYSLIELGLRDPGIDLALEISSLFERSLRDLFKPSDVEPSDSVSA